MPLKTSFDQTKTKVSHVSVCSYLAPHVLMYVFVYRGAHFYHGVLRWAPIDSVSPYDHNPYVGCASRISNKGVMSEFRCSDRLALFAHG